jgi:hypothetical protein
MVRPIAASAKIIAPLTALLLVGCAAGAEDDLDSGGTVADAGSSMADASTPMADTGTAVADTGTSATGTGTTLIDSSVTPDSSTAEDGGPIVPEDAATAGGVGSVPTCGAAVSPGDRVITVTNDCPGQTISIGVNGGFVQNCDNGSCPTGMTCSTGRSPPGCFWDFPQPACGSSVLAAGATATYVLNAPPAGNPPLKWSGNIYASTHCASDGTGCQTAQCATSLNGHTVVGSCPDGVGPEGPVTLAEFTLVSAGSDFYDVSAINGINVPVTMGPIGGTSSASSPYTCGTAGAVTAVAGLEACSWSFNPSIVLDGVATDQSTLLRAVTPGGGACASDSECSSSGQVCGTALSFGDSAATQSCGQQVGWWTADELCAYTGNTLEGVVNCNAGVSGQGTQADLYGCNGPNACSGYSSAGCAAACGCPDWNINGQPLTVPSGFKCYSDNSAWQSVAEPWAAFVKNACATAYSFPFDDATSTFTCATANPSTSNPNSAGYAITFCPDGNDGM